MLREIEDDAIKIEYDEKEVCHTPPARAIVKFIARNHFDKKGEKRLKAKAKVYADLLVFSRWLDDKIGELEVELSDKDVEMYFHDSNRLVITRQITNDKATFLEPITSMTVKRAQNQLIGHKLKGKNNVSEDYDG